MRKTILTLVGLVSLFLILAACGNEEAETEEELVISEEEKLSEDELVVTVNEDEVKGVTYNLVYAQLKLHALQTGQDVSDDEIKEKTIESLIDRQLLMQQADEEGMLVSEAEAKEELDLLKEENQEGLDTLLEQFQITEELFKHQLVFELTMNEYLVKKIEVEVEVTEEDVEEAYEEIKAENEDIPELTEIYDTLKGQVEATRTNEMLEEKINALKDESDIEVHI